MRKLTAPQKVYFEHVVCDLCGCPEYKVRYRKPDTFLWLNQFEFPVVECIKCGLVYVNPRPTPDSMMHYYPGDYFFNRDTPAYLEKYKIQLEFIGGLKKEKILDIGCARGDWLIFLKQEYPGIDCTGIDYYCDSVKSKDLHFQKKSLPGCDFRDSEFDLITAWSVFEHLHNPGEYFQEVSRILKKGGKFIFLVTNSESLYGKRAYKEDIPRHLYHFSPKTLSLYAGKYGFDFSRCFYDDRIWDGRGSDSFYYTSTFLFGLNWDKIYRKKIGFIKTQIGRVGRFLDKIIFRTHWEARLKRSGIIICEFTKKNSGEHQGKVPGRL